jgi:hypothetical protein
VDQQTALFQGLGADFWLTVACYWLALYVLGFLAFWLASKVITPATGTLANAGKYYLYSFLAGLVYGIQYHFAGYLLAYFAGMQSTEGLKIEVALLFIVVEVGWLIVMQFAILMRVYKIGVGKAFGFFLTTCVFALLIFAIAGIGVMYEGERMPGIKSLKAAGARLEEFGKKIRQQRIAALKSASPPSPQETPTVAATTPVATATPVVTATPPAPVRPRPIPGEVTLTAPVQISVMIDGRSAGDVTLQPGAHVKLISVESDQLKIQYMDTVTTIPRKSTDFSVMP